MSLKTHLFVYAVLLAGVLALFPTSGSFSSDDGAYAGQVFALQQGGWALERPDVVVPPENEGWVNSHITNAGPVPYVRHPAYIYLLLASTSLFGNEIGLALPAAGGALMCVAVAWALALEFNRAYAPLAFWVAAGSPLLVNSTTFWAHTLAASLTGAALWSGLRIAKRRSRQNWHLVALLSLTSVGAILLRTEAALWFAALAVGSVVLERSHQVVVAFGFAAAPSGAAFVGDLFWRRHILGQFTEVSVAGSAEPGWLGSRLPAGWHILFQPGRGPLAALLVAGCGLLLVGVVRYFRVGSSASGAPPSSNKRQGGLFLGAAGVAYLAALFCEPGTVSGLLPAWPLLLVALLASRNRATPTDSRLAWLYLPAVGFVSLVLATQYSAGGGFEWGARYLSPAVVGLSVWVASRLQPMLSRAPVALCLIVAAPAILGLSTSYRYHARNADFVAVATETQPDAVVTNRKAGTRIAWSALPTAWYSADSTNLEEFLKKLESANVDRVVLYGFDHKTLDSGSLAGYHPQHQGPGVTLLTL